MSKFHCVLDTSALLKKYRPEDGSEIIKILFNRDDCAIHILNVTIPEVTGAFVRWQLDGEYKSDQREILKDLFIEDITEYKVVIHNITDRNIIKTDDIWNYSISVPQPKRQAADREMTCPKCKHSFVEKIKKTKPRVGPVDVLVISVCLALKQSYGQAYLFSSDEHMLKVAGKMGIKFYNPEELRRLPFKY